MSFSPENTQGNFLPEDITIPEDKGELDLLLKTTLESHARLINRKDTGQYETVEVQNNQTYPGTTPQDKRFIFRKIIVFGAIVAGATSPIVHGISSFTDMVRIFGTCITDVIDYRPIPFASTVAVNQNIQVIVTAANVTIINGAASPNLTSARIVLEYYKN
ncbi:unnamed protein product [marine sediment metagenome]|uniref:Uncharacterized protein n=1 Tax=marine sediment metagenome TaxID=412755 RepID=X0VY83_9ZZZZ